MITGLGLLLAELNIQRFPPLSAESLVEVKLLKVAFQTVLGQRVELKAAAYFQYLDAQVSGQVVARLAPGTRVGPTVGLAVDDGPDGERLAGPART